jgi:uncharacterized protein (DUF1697 family)
MRFVALFRGINVGKAKRIAMGDLRTVFEALGYARVQTLLNSGNVVFDGGRQSSATHAARIRAAVAEQLGVDALVIVKSARELGGAVVGNELLDGCGDASRLLVVFAVDTAALAALQPLAEQDWGADRLTVGPHAAYLWCDNGVLDSRLAVRLLRHLDTTGTTRNWATVEKLHALLQLKEA